METKEKKEKLTKEELSRVRSIAGRKGGRKSGYGKGRAPTKTVTVRKADYDILVAYADLRQFPIAEGIHRLCVGLTKKYSELSAFAPASPASAS